MLRRMAIVKNRRFEGVYRLHHQGAKNQHVSNN
jgi:hypothetical protein